MHDVANILAIFEKENPDIENDHPDWEKFKITLISNLFNRWSNECRKRVISGEVVQDLRDHLHNIFTKIEYIKQIDIEYKDLLSGCNYWCILKPSIMDYKSSPADVKSQVDNLIFKLTTLKKIEDSFDPSVLFNDWHNYKQIVVSEANEFEKMLKKSDRFIYLISKYDFDKSINLINEKFYLGMTKEELIDSKERQPDKSELVVLKTKTKEILVYGNKSSGDIFTFVDDKLESFKDR